MSTRPEVVLYSSLTDVDRLEYLAREGLDIAAIPTVPLRPMVEWAIKYFFESGCRQAPSREALLLEWGAVLEAEAIVLDDEQDETETMEWVVGYLKSTFVHLEWQQWTKRAAGDMATAFTDDRVQVLADHTAELGSLLSKVRSQSSETSGVAGIDAALRRYEERRAMESSAHGLMFGLTLVDQHTHGIHPGELAVMAAGPKVGKAQPLDTPVLTPKGWTVMGAIKVGDKVIGVYGDTIKVTHVHPSAVRDIYRVTMSDGSSTRCCGDHLWSIQGTRLHRAGNLTKWRTLSTLDLKALVDSGAKHSTFLPMAQAVRFAKTNKKLPIDPYLLGIILGKARVESHQLEFSSMTGEMRKMITPLLPEGSHLHEIVASKEGVTIKGEGHAKHPLTDALRTMGLAVDGPERFVPDCYLRASIKDRLRLLSGLMDSGKGLEMSSGYAAPIFTTRSEAIHDDVVELVESLGGTCVSAIKRKAGTPGVTNPSYTLRPRLPRGVEIFGLPTNRALAALGTARTRHNPSRRVVSVELDGRESAQCITVDADDGLYLTERYIVTHNSWVTAKAVLTEWTRGRRGMLFTLENSVEMTIDRMICLHAKVDYRQWQRGTCTTDQMDRVLAAREEMAAMIGDMIVVMPPVGRRTVDAMVREAGLRGADSITIDQLTFVESVGTAHKARHEVVRDIMHELKSSISTGNNKIPCLLAHQINREGIKAADKTGHLELFMLAESSEVERTADWVFGLYRSEEERRVDLAKLQVLASRREDINAWMMAYKPGEGTIETIREMEINRG